jgi:hypothetical protein
MQEQQEPPRKQKCAVEFLRAPLPSSRSKIEGHLDTSR